MREELAVENPNSGDAEGGLCDLVTRGSKNPLWMGLPYRLSSLRVSAGLSAVAVNAMAGLGHGSANRLEDRIHRPRIDTVEQLAAALGVSPSWLAFGPEGVSPFKQKRPRPLLPDELPQAQLGSTTLRDRYLGCGGRLRQSREAQGLSLRQVVVLAKQRTSELKISHQAILYTETAVTVPRVDTIEALATALSVAPGWLAFGETAGELH